MGMGMVAGRGDGNGETLVMTGQDRGIHHAIGVAAFHQNQFEEGVERRFPDWSFTSHKLFRGPRISIRGWFYNSRCKQKQFCFCRIWTLALPPSRWTCFLIWLPCSAHAVPCRPIPCRLAVALPHSACPYTGSILLVRSSLGGTVLQPPNFGSDMRRAVSCLSRMGSDLA